MINAIDAVEVVLDEAGRPLDYREITELILAKGLWQTKGLTPAATINARLAVDIKDLGAGSRFQRTKPGVFALRRWGLAEVAARGSKRKQAEVSTPDQPQSTQIPVAAAPGPGNARQAKTDPLLNDKPFTKPAAALSFIEAAEAVLEQFGRKQPMHYKAITEKALALGLVSTKGLTPEASLYAQGASTICQ
jgi:restriction system protein